ncbi:group XIIB secretory phospholipase A2-like protein isoform X3 [Oryctolagus cuniculus]|uniref:group XIIB secretory phospholipase A2-like protein isoform X3 n=1 Tax=Oryctolagus cuniculus TaxID=9986 RepID=UPI00387964DC
MDRKDTSAQTRLQASGAQRLQLPFPGSQGTGKCTYSQRRLPGCLFQLRIFQELPLMAATITRICLSLGPWRFKLTMDLGIPAMTKCCNQLDVCYDTCGANKYRCDAKFRWCLHSICSDLKRSLGFVSKVEAACDSLADTVFNTVWTLGCRPFMNSQRAACICAEEEKEEL